MAAKDELLSLLDEIASVSNSLSDEDTGEDVSTADGDEYTEDSSSHPQQFRSALSPRCSTSDSAALHQPSPIRSRWTAERPTACSQFSRTSSILWPPCTPSAQCWAHGSASTDGPAHLPGCFQRFESRLTRPPTNTPVNDQVQRTGSPPHRAMDLTGSE